MLSRTSLFRLLPGFFAVLSLSVAGCASESGDEEERLVCEMNPESQVRATGRGLNGENLNGQNLNGKGLNGIQANGVQTNGTQVNGIQTNGIQTNGIQVNGLQTNGIQVNGIQSNGLQVNGLQVNGASANELVGTLADGKVVHGEAFVGAKLPGLLADGRTIELVVSAFERSADGALAYYQIDFNGENICGEGVKGMFIPGAWDERAARHDELVVSGQRITTSYSCTTGVLAKCVHWGYAPWKVGADLHQACTRMGRADYCGSGVSFTKDGTTVDIYDRQGIETPTSDDASLVFEAGWGPNGAVCVSRTRYDAKTTSGEPVLPSCWSSLPKCSSFEEAKAQGATVGNSSRIQSRTLCSAAAGTTSPAAVRSLSLRCEKDRDTNLGAYGRPTETDAECKDTNPGTLFR